MQGGDRAAQRAFLERSHPSRPNLAWLGFTDQKDVVRAAAGRLREGQDVSNRPCRGLTTSPRQALARSQTDRVERHPEAIEPGAARTDEMTAALLELARTSQRGPNRRDVNMDALPTVVIDARQLDLADRDVNWEVSDLPTVEGDASSLWQVLENAVKHTCGRNLAVIRVWAEQGMDDSALCVHDNGAGIDPEHAVRPFGAL